MCPAVGPGQTLFGNTQNKLGTALGTMGTFGTTGFNSGTSTLGFGATQPVGERPRVLEMRTDYYLRHHLVPSCLFYAAGKNVTQTDLRLLFHVHTRTRGALTSSRFQPSQIPTQRLPSRPCCSSSSACWRTRHTETRRSSETRSQTPRRKRR